MKLSFSTLSCPDWNIDKIINFAVKNNFDGVELMGKNPHISLDIRKSECKIIKNKFDAKNLDIPCITAYTRFNYDNLDIRKKNINELKKMIDIASDMGAKYIRTFGSSHDNQFNLDQVLKWIVEAFTEIDNYAKTKDVKVLLETHDFLSKGENCGVLWDVAHSIRAGEKMTSTIKYLKDYIYHVHIKDWININSKKEDYYVLLGAGELQIEKLLLELNNINYNGYLSLEWEKKWHPEIEESEIAIEQYSKKMKNLFNDLKFKLN